MSRKTFSVEAFKESVNKFLAMDESRAPEARQAMMCQLESILHSTGNYEGFSYLAYNQINVANATPGINRTPDGSFEEDYDARFAGTDRTRVRYF